MAGEEKLREYLKRVTVDLASAKKRLAEADEPIAVIGMACRFPGAENVGAYWDLLREGRAAEITDPPPGRFAEDTKKIRKGAFLPEVAGWDAGFFGYAPQEALRMDPQQRLLMELAWEAMEDAGTPAPSLAGSRTGVLLGFSDSFQYGQVEAEREGTDVYADPFMGQGSLASVVAGRLAYHFDLRGPAFSLDTACSSTLVAVHLASKALRGGEADYVLAGGGFLALHPFLYVYSSENALLSPTDRCHTFDASADGYMMGEGGGMVMLARLSDALRDGHRIRAVIRGSAVNQDGRSNGLTAPNRGAQVDVIRRALIAAKAQPDDVDYLEAHGSGTALGDEIELGALGDVFGKRQRPLTVGAVKTNIGHTHTAAGIAGLIKTVLVLENGVVPPNLNMPNPADQVTANSSVRPSAALAPLPEHGRAPVAGVSSFGWSGTNAHVVLEAPPAAAQTEGTAVAVLPVSAASEPALAARLKQLAETTAPLSDLAHTLQSGRAHLPFRRAVVATSAEDAATQFAAATPARSTKDKPSVAFLLPGVGDQYRGLGRTLYDTEPVFTAAVDECLRIAQDRCDVDLRTAFFAEPLPEAETSLFGAAPADPLLDHAELAHPFLFTIEYALAQLLADRGVKPDLLVGYSLGEYVAACLSGVFTLADALWVVTERARLIESAPAGRMLAVAADADRIRAALADSPVQVDIAALNGPQMTVLSGAPAEIDHVSQHLHDAGIAARALRSAHPFHSTLLAPAQDKLAALIATVSREKPRIPILSNATGTPLTDAQAVDPKYWAEHLCLPVRFADGTRHCLAQGVDAYVELGPGQTLGGLVRQNITGDERPLVLGTLPAPWTRSDETVSLLETCARLWETGVTLAFTTPGKTVSLPPYPFQRTRFWPQARKSVEAAPETGRTYVPVWRPDPTRPAPEELDGTLVVFADDDGVGTRLADLAEAAGTPVVEVVAGAAFERTGRTVVIDPADPTHYQELFKELTGPLRVAHLWSLGRSGAHEAIRYGFDSLLLAVQAFGSETRLLTVSAGATEIIGGDLTAPDGALVHGLGRGVRAEYPGLTWRGVDTDDAAHLWEELRRGPWTHADPAAEPVLTGWRNGRRWLQTYTEITVDDTADTAETADTAAGENPWQGTYLITGGTRGIGMILAKHLVRSGVRQLALVGRTDLDRAAGPKAEQSRQDVAELRAAGAEVLTLTADAGAPDQLRAALNVAAKHYGELTGIIHAAGLPGGGLTARQTPAGARQVIAPKVLAMGPLVEAKPKVLVLFSSIASLVGGIGEADYCAANSVADAYGTTLSTSDTQVITVAWGHWQHDDWQSETTGAGRVAYRKRYGFSDEAGCAVLDRLVAGGVRGTVVALRQDLQQARRELAVLNDLGELMETTPATSRRFPRPPLRIGYAAPRTDLEKRIADVWGEFLGIDGVGVHDPFFDLGGNSLVGMAMVAALEKLLDRKIAAAVLFGHPTVAEFAAALDAPAADQPGPVAASARGERRRRAGTRIRK